MHKTYLDTQLNVGSEKSFGLVFAVVFLVVGLYPLLKSQPIYIWAISTSVFFIFSAFFWPKILVKPNQIWFKFGMILGTIIAPIVMFIIYALSVFPTGMIMRILGKDLLKCKLDKHKKTYWNDREEPIGPMKNQY
tara:strand:- start:49 stop:453 length:405 start_codon:yes stop_codon:yes gene_type:complete